MPGGLETELYLGLSGRMLDAYHCMECRRKVDGGRKQAGKPRLP